MATETRLDEILDRVHAQIVAKRRGVRLQRLANDLCTELEVPPGRALVPHLTSQPHVHDNEQAVRIWLGEQLMKADDDSVLRSADTLRRLLVLKLDSIQRNLA
jgi:hypothetical protein